MVRPLHLVVAREHVLRRKCPSPVWVYARQDLYPNPICWVLQVPGNPLTHGGAPDAVCNRCSSPLVLFGRAPYAHSPSSKDADLQFVSCCASFATAICSSSHHSFGAYRLSIHLGHLVCTSPIFYGIQFSAIAILCPVRCSIRSGAEPSIHPARAPHRLRARASNSSVTMSPFFTSLFVFCACLNGATALGPWQHFVTVSGINAESASPQTFD